MRNIFLAMLVSLVVIAVFVLPKKEEKKQSVPGNTSITQPAVTRMQAQISLEIFEPKNGIVVSQNGLLVRGKTSPRAEIFVNDQVTKADAQGDFAITVILDEGENTILVIVNDEQGNYAEKELTVTWE